MSRLLYYIIILPLSVMPNFMLYGLSNVFFLIVYYVITYRKKLVTQNLRRALPELSEAERKSIRKKYYHHFCDLIVESLKNFTISSEQVKKRMVILNPQVVNDQLNAGRKVILAGGHYNNWELYALSVPLATDGKILAIYKPLSDRFLNSKMLQSRSKNGLEMIPIKNVKRRMAELEHEAYAMIYAFDQSPRNPDKAYWTDFMGINSPCLFGTEKNAVESNSVVVYGHMHKVKRGHYTVTYQLVTDRPTEEEYGWITTRINNLLEENIRKKPEHWLWTHRRWKHVKS